MLGVALPFGLATPTFIIEPNKILSNILAPKFHRRQFCFRLNALVVIEEDIVINDPSCFSKSLYLNPVNALSL